MQMEPNVTKPRRQLTDDRNTMMTRAFLRQVAEVICHEFGETEDEARESGSKTVRALYWATQGQEARKAWHRALDGEGLNNIYAGIARFGQWLVQHCPASVWR
jgi:hypothetical protein